MATINPLEGRTVHQIQSGQVIVDLCSVVKELVENSLDAKATSIEVRFKNNGLDAIEVQDNGEGIAKENFETIGDEPRNFPFNALLIVTALKHYTSKLTTFDDLSSLKTFGFRGEALSSLCALSKFHIVTARAGDAPKGTRLDFEVSGNLQGTQVVASQQGTTVAVENLFKNLPVRRRELEKNIKREYGKVLGVLQVYACISTNARISVTNLMAKGKKVVVFATKSNPTTRENIANVYGAKALPGLVEMDLRFEMHSTKTSVPVQSTGVEVGEERIHVLGHVSRPIFGEGRQTPDRQMFFVNSRPCALPQMAKVFNEVYKSFNISQSPFIFANIILNTNAYDVNVSPDKRSILLHDQNTLLESLRHSLTDLFEKQDQTVPQSSRYIQKLPSFRPLSLSRETSRSDECETPAANKDSEPLNAASEDLVEVAREDEVISNDDTTFARDEMSTTVMESFLNQNTRERTGKSTKTQRGFNGQKSKENQYRLEENLSKTTEHFESDNHYEEDGFNETESLQKSPPFPVRGMHQEMAEPQYAVDRSETPSCSEKNKYLSRSSRDQDQASASNVSSVVQNAFNRMRSKRNSMEIATVTIGPNTTTAILGSSSSKRRRVSNSPSALESSPAAHDFSTQNFSSSIRAFAAPDTQLVQPARQQLATRYASRHPDSEEAALSATDDSSDPCTDSEHENERHHLSASVAEGSQPMNDRLSDHSALNEEGLHDESSDSEFLDEEDKKLKEDIKVARLIYQAEEKLARPSENNVERAYQILEKCGRKDAPAQLMQIVQTSDYQINRQMQSLEKCTSRSSEADDLVEPAVPSDEESAEKLLSLTISKEDFSRMHIVGQFNLGFILTTRQGVTNGPSLSSAFDEIFIIDQHASDEKYNFERLQSSTVVQNQRLVRPHTLDLTAIEEEIILENNETLLKNGFVVSVDTSGDEPVGQRCKLLSLPMSREVTFDTTDLEELIALLADSPHVSSATILSLEKTNSNIPRPSKVRRMFAMRACRSSVMIGKSLNKRQMQRLVGHMGEIDKPWNCPHGRPTMRHVLSLGAWEGWREGQGLIGMGEEYDEAVPDWRRFLDRRRRKVENKEMEKEEEMDEEEDNESENYDNDDEEDDDKETEDWKETSAEERPN